MGTPRIRALFRPHILSLLAGVGIGIGSTILWGRGADRRRSYESNEPVQSPQKPVNPDTSAWNTRTRSWTNWARTVVQQTMAVSWPSSKQELQSILIRSNAKGTKVRFVGEGMAYNAMAGSPSHMIFTSNLNRILWVDKQINRVRVEGGIRFCDLAVHLQTHYGLTFPIIPLGHGSPTLGGALATAAHGTGGRFSALGDFVESFELITSS